MAAPCPATGPALEARPNEAKHPELGAGAPVRIDPPLNSNFFQLNFGPPGAAGGDSESVFGNVAPPPPPREPPGGDVLKDFGPPGGPRGAIF